MSEAPEEPQPPIPTVEDWLDGDWKELGEPAGGGSDATQELHASDSSAVAQQLVVHSLLIGQFESTASRENRIQATLDAFDQLSETSASERALPSTRPQVAYNRWLFGLITAATLLVAIAAWAMLGPQPAEAALSRVVAATSLPVTRVYEAKIYRRMFRREVQREATLYSKSVDLFAAEFPETRVRSKAWIGFDGEQRWLVADNYQWTSNDEGDLRGDELIDRITTRNMHFNALLTEGPDSFDLRLLPRETLSIGGTSFDCQPIEATPRDPANGLPEVLRIWPHPQSGVILQMHLIVNGDGPRGVRRIELRFLREQEVPEEFFTLQFHQPK